MAVQYIGGKKVTPTTNTQPSVDLTNADFSKFRGFGLQDQIAPYFSNPQQTAEKGTATVSPTGKISIEGFKPTTTTTPTTTIPTTSTQVSTIKPVGGSGGSIVDYLAAQNKPTSFSSRAELAKSYGIENYTGTASQNLELLSKLRAQDAASSFPDTSLTPPEVTSPPPPTETRLPGESIADFAARTSGGVAPAEPSSVIATSDAQRAQLLEQVKKEILPATGLPEAPSTAEERIRLRAEQGIVNDEQDLNDLRNESRLAQEEMRQFKAKTGAGMTEFGRLGAVSETERNLSFRLEGLALREQSLVERINTKNSYINQAIQDQQTDYQNALNKWNTEFQVNSKINDVVNTQLDDIQKDAINTITTIQNLMKDSGVAYEDWPEEMKIQAQNAALKAGLPKDTFQIAYGALQQDEKVITTVVTETPDGKKEVYAVTQGADGLGLIQVGTTGPIKQTGTGTSGSVTDIQAQLDNYALDKAAGREVPTWAENYLVPEVKDGVETGKYIAKKITKGSVESVISAKGESEAKAIIEQTKLLSDPNFVASQILDDLNKGAGYNEIRTAALAAGVPIEVYRQALQIVLQSQ